MARRSIPKAADAAPPDPGFASLRGARVLITGGAGMLGSTIAGLAARAGCEVTAVDNFAPLYGGNRFNLREVAKDVRLVRGDIRDRRLMSTLVEGQDVIFNLAAQVSYVDSNVDPFSDLDINCRGHLVVLEACRLRNPKARLVFASSRFVYGAIERNPVDESHPTNCLSIYGVHKLNGEKYYHFYHYAHGMDTLIFRIANPYGPRQQMKHGKYGILNWFVRRALAGHPLTIFGRGLQKRDYVFVEDAARAMLVGAARKGIRHDVFNLGSGTGVAFRDMARLVARLAGGVPIKFLAWPKERYFVETGDYVSDISRIRRRLGWLPSVSLEEGVARTVEFYRRHGRHYGI